MTSVVVETSNVATVSVDVGSVVVEGSVDEVNKAVGASSVDVDRVV